MHSFSIYLIFHLVVGFIFGIFALIVIKQEFSNFEEFFNEFSREVDPQLRPLLFITSTPYNILALLTLMGVIGPAIWIVKKMR
jgi:hypothetical protein